MAEESTDITLESFDDNQKAFINKLVEEKTKEVSKPDIDFTQASEFIRNQGGIIFAKEDDFKSKKLDAARSIAANWETDARKSIKANTGVEWNDGELLPDYAKRAISEAKKQKLDGAFSAELETTKNELAKREQKLRELSDRLNAYQEEKEQQIFKQSVDKAIEGKVFSVPQGTSESEKQDLFEFYNNKFYNWVNNTFERSKDEQGTTYLKHKGTGKVSSNISEFISEYLNQSGLKFGSSTTGYNMPNGQDGVSDEAKKKALDALKNEMFAKGKSPQSPEFWAKAIHRGLKSEGDISGTKPKFKQAVKQLLQRM